jgi:hypothetical protein
VTDFTCEPGGADRGRLAAHLAESRRLLTAPLEKMDTLMFRLPPAAVVIVTPVTQACDAIAAAAAQRGTLRARLPELTKQDAYVVSHWLECSRDRAQGRGWQHQGDDAVATAVERIRQAWDGQFGVEGSELERAALRTAAAWKKPSRWRPQVPRGAIGAFLGTGDPA